MTNITRRAFNRGLAALPVIAAPAVAAEAGTLNARQRFEAAKAEFTAAAQAIDPSITSWDISFAKSDDLEMRMVAIGKRVAEPELPAERRMRLAHELQDALAEYDDGRWFAQIYPGTEGAAPAPLKLDGSPRSRVMRLARELQIALTQDGGNRFAVIDPAKDYVSFLRLDVGGRHPTGVWLGQRA